MIPFDYKTDNDSGGSSFGSLVVPVWCQSFQSEESINTTTRASRTTFEFIYKFYTEMKIFLVGVFPFGAITKFVC